MQLADSCLYLDKRGGEASLKIEQKDREFVIQLWELFDNIGLVGARRRTYGLRLWRCGGALSSSALRPSKPLGQAGGGHTTLAELAVVRRRAAPPYPKFKLKFTFLFYSSLQKDKRNPKGEEESKAKMSE
jgi:hypothetical protein